MPKLYFLPVIAALFLIHGLATAQAPDNFSFQGYLADNEGNPLDTVVTIVTKIYDGPTVLHEQTHVDVPVTNGIVSLVIVNTDSISFDDNFDLGVTVGTDSEISPRRPILMAPYAQSLISLRVYPNATSANLVGGHKDNTAAYGIAGATIGGGGTAAFPNQVNASHGTVGGGRGNTTSNTYATISGGDQNSSSGAYSTIGGGSSNSVSFAESTVGGGGGNSADGIQATVAGGGNNVAGNSNATVGGGDNNQATGASSVIGGGNNNQTTTVGSVISGGQENSITGDRAAIAGGQGGNADGDHSFVAAGDHNWASGDGSFAAGTRASALHDGAFVWQDESAATGSDTLRSNAPNQFIARGSGGFFFYTAAANDVTTGVTVDPGGSGWNSISSRSAKENFRRVEPTEYLKRLSDIEIYEWHYKTQEPGVTHVGPFAEDFHAAFGHGSSDRTINTTDADGVALVAIQGLYKLVQEQQAEIERLRRIVEDRE